MNDVGKKIAIAIDGPSAAGKSTVARKIAERMGFLYIDTGALYRAIGCYALENGASTTAAAEVVALLDKINLTLSHSDGMQHVLLNGEDVSNRIRLPEMSMAASNVSAIPKVREFLLELQRDIARNNNVVMDGRDIATVVLPDADIKFFLTASAEVRARRRFLEYEEKGVKVDFQELFKETCERDYNDSHRETAPLKPAQGAVTVDSTNMTLGETADYMLNILREKL